MIEKDKNKNNRQLNVETKTSFIFEIHFFLLIKTTNLIIDNDKQ